MNTLTCYWWWREDDGESSQTDTGFSWGNQEVSHRFMIGDSNLKASHLGYYWHLDSSILCCVGGPPKDKMCSISGPWPPSARSTHQPTMWPPRLHFKCHLEGGSISCRDEMITILPLLKPHSEKNVRGKISTFLSEAKFLTNPLDWPNTLNSSGCCVRKVEGYV